MQRLNLGHPALAKVYRRGFPHSLDGAPFLMPGENSMLGRSLEQWFNSEGIRPLFEGPLQTQHYLRNLGEQGQVFLRSEPQWKARRRSNYKLN